MRPVRGRQRDHRRLRRRDRLARTGPDRQFDRRAREQGMCPVVVILTEKHRIKRDKLYFDWDVLN